MGKLYEPSRRPKSSYIGSHHVDPPAGPRAGLPDDVKEYGACPRPFCGGLILRRAAVTGNGDCYELVCVACGRSRALGVLEPYQAMKQERSRAIEKILSPRRDACIGRGVDVGEVEIPKEIRHAIFDE